MPKKMTASEFQDYMKDILKDDITTMYMDDDDDDEDDEEESEIHKVACNAVLDTIIYLCQEVRSGKDPVAKATAAEKMSNVYMDLNFTK